LLILDMRSELLAEAEGSADRARLSQYHALLLGFCRDWRQLYSLHGENHEGWEEFKNLRDSMREKSQSLGQGLAMRTNRTAAHRVLEARVLRACLSARA
jgi:hypothetical protein